MLKWPHVLLMLLVQQQQNELEWTKTEEKANKNN